MMLFLPLYRWSTMPIFQCPRFFSSPLISTTSPTLILKDLSLFFRLCFSLRATRYSCFHLFHKASLEHVYMIPEVNSNCFETPNCFEMLFPFHGNLEHVYMRPKVNSNRFEISLRGKISLRCKVTSLTAFT